MRERRLEKSAAAEHEALNPPLHPFMGSFREGDRRIHLGTGSYLAQSISPDPASRNIGATEPPPLSFTMW
jgi:hypothetical protein